MARIKAVSFDMEGTLVDHAFSNLIWENDIPSLYGKKHGLSFETARKHVLSEYEKIGDNRPEWYDVDYWFKRLGLSGDWRKLLEKRREYCKVYPEALSVLNRLSSEYSLIISSNTIRDFLEVQLEKFPRIFSHVFSAASDFKEVKKSCTPAKGTPTTPSEA